MKVADLSSEELDYWVMRALSSDPARVIRGRPRPYSSEWGDRGPIIEHNDCLLPYISAAHRLHLGPYTSQTPAGFEYSGNTPLIAAMRAYVASKFGDEVTEEK